MKKRYLNFGCGKKYNPEWTNLDFATDSPEVIASNLMDALPFDDQSFTACYSSHVIEHFHESDALKIFKEVYRVLSPGGIFRVVVPDFEDCTKEYLSTLQALRSGKGFPENHEWIRVELIDQFVRDDFGGEMQKLLHPHVANREYIESRIGVIHDYSNKPSDSKKTLSKIKKLTIKKIIGRIRNKVVYGFIYLTCGRKVAKNFMQTLFRQSGELHKSIWDEYSLSNALLKSGFTNITTCTPFKSGISDFSNSGLDVSLSSKIIYRPHSLYIEAMKP